MNKQKNSAKENIDTQKISLRIANYDLLTNQLNKNQVQWLIETARKVLKQDPIILHLCAPIKIIGDICGHYEQLTKIFQIIGNPGNKNYLFLGNYVGKGPNSLQSLISLLFFKVKYPQYFFLLRGRFEKPDNNYMFGFYDECLQKYGLEIWMSFNQIFNFLPLAAVIQKKIYCMSSGLSLQIKTIEQMNKISRNAEILQISQINQILESKPKKYQKKESHSSKYFEQNILTEWMSENKLSLVIRSNEVLDEGFQFSFKNLLLTICSIPNFLKVGNLGAIVTINQDLIVSFEVLK